MKWKFRAELLKSTALMYFAPINPSMFPYAQAFARDVGFIHSAALARGQ